MAFACDIKVIGVIDNCAETRKRSMGRTSEWPITNFGETEDFSLVLKPSFVFIDFFQSFFKDFKGNY